MSTHYNPPSELEAKARSRLQDLKVYLLKQQQESLQQLLQIDLALPGEFQANLESLGAHQIRLKALNDISKELGILEKGSRNAERQTRKLYAGSHAGSSKPEQPGDQSDNQF